MEDLIISLITIYFIGFPVLLIMLYSESNDILGVNMILKWFFTRNPKVTLVGHLLFLVVFLVPLIIMTLLFAASYIFYILFCIVFILGNLIIVKRSLNENIEYLKGFLKPDKKGD